MKLTLFKTRRYMLAVGLDIYPTGRYQFYVEWMYPVKELDPRARLTGKAMSTKQFNSAMTLTTTSFDGMQYRYDDVSGEMVRK